MPIECAYFIVSSTSFSSLLLLIDDVIVDIDITFTEKTDKVTYSTDMCLVERLEHIKAIDKDKYTFKNEKEANFLLTNAGSSGKRNSATGL